MSYTPTEWDSGDIITAEKLNKIEQGISEVSNSGGSGGGSTSSGLVIQKDAEGRLDKTWQEIHDALASGIVPVILLPDNTDAEYGSEDAVSAVTLLEHQTGSELSGLYTINDGYGSVYTCESASGYPLISEG